MIHTHWTVQTIKLFSQREYHVGLQNFWEVRWEEMRGSQLSTMWMDSFMHTLSKSMALFMCKKKIMDQMCRIWKGLRGKRIWTSTSLIYHWEQFQNSWRQSNSSIQKIACTQKRTGRRRILSPRDECSLVQKMQLNLRTALVKMLKEIARQVSISTGL